MDSCENRIPDTKRQRIFAADVPHHGGTYDRELLPQDWSFPWMDDEGKAAWNERASNKCSQSRFQESSLSCKDIAASQELDFDGICREECHSVATSSFSAFTEAIKVEREAELGEPAGSAELDKVAGGALSDAGAELPKLEGEQGGESSENNASQGTTQNLGKADEAAAEASTAQKSGPEDLHELANRGLCAPLWRTAKPAQPGVGVPDVDQLQNGWCNYNGLPGVQRGSMWLAAKSPSVQAKVVHPADGGSIHLGSVRGAPHMALAPGKPARSLQGAKEEQPQQQQGLRAEEGSSIKPPTGHHPILPPSPFSKTALPLSPFQAARQSEAAANLHKVLSGDSPISPSSQTKFQWPEDAQSPRYSLSDGNQRHDAANNTLTRQVSLPDLGALEDLWTEMSNMPDDFGFDLEPMPSLPKLGSLTLPSQSLLRQSSIAKLMKGQEPTTPVGALLHDIKAHRRSRSMKITTALTWQPGLEPVQAQRRTSGRLQSLQMAPVPREVMAADRSSSSGHRSSGDDGMKQARPDLPDHVQLSIINAPSIFAVPTCINKSFKPPFSVRVTVVSSRPTQIKATVAAYTLQKEQVAKLEHWHPSQHIFTESLAGSIISETIVCEGPDNSKTGESFEGKHVGVGDLTFTDLKFNASSRMKPRWVVFALALPTDDVIYTQYTVPTIVMSRQCDQTPKALAILRGEPPTRKRSRQHELPEGPRSKSVYSGTASAPPPQLAGRAAGQLLPRPGISTGALSHPGPQLPDQGSMIAGSIYGEEGKWPQRGPYTMSKWREAIVKVCRDFGLTRSFEQEDMHELAKVAGFMGNPQTSSQQTTVLSAHQWNAFGRWFISYLHIFKDHRDLWMSPAVVCICGFSMTRERAEQLLNAQPDGTFILRPSLSMESTVVISVNVSGRVYHLAIDSQQMETRTIEEWVRELPDVSTLLDIASGIRYPKHHVFRNRHPVMLPPTPSLLGLHGGLMSPVVGPQPVSPGTLLPVGQAQGTDVFSQFFDAARRPPNSFSPQLSHFTQSQPSLGSPSDNLGQLFDQWGHMDLHDPFRGQQVGGHIDPHLMRTLHQSHQNHMRFGGR